MAELHKNKLDDDTIAQHLDSLEGWSRDGDSIKREISFDGGFLAAIAFINRVAPLAEELDHHPELFNVYDRVELTLTTHDAGGLTPYDFELARRIDDAVAG